MKPRFSLLAMLVLLFPLMACAESTPTESYLPGKHYMVLDAPVRTRDATKIEVVEVFWHGCPHCYDFEPLVKAWKKTAGDDVDFWQSPAMWRANMNIHAQAFYTAKALGVLHQLNDALFTSLVVERKKLDDQDEVAALFAKYGVERADFDKAFNSFSVKSQVKQADARARSYQITGTPELIVNGKYRVSGRTAGSKEAMIKVVDYLIAKERAAAKQ